MTSPACGTGVVVFDYSSWIMQFPEFAAVSQPVAQGYFDALTLGGLVDNTPQSIIQNPTQRAMLLNYATAHFAVLRGALNPSQAQSVGRVASAAQGSVSVQLEMDVKGGAGAAYWNQTQYGAFYYQATLPFRTAVYIPPLAPQPTLPFFGRAGLGFGRRW